MATELDKLLALLNDLGIVHTESPVNWPPSSAERKVCNIPDDVDIARRVSIANYSVVFYFDREGVYLGSNFGCSDSPIFERPRRQPVA